MPGEQMSAAARSRIEIVLGLTLISFRSGLVMAVVGSGHRLLDLAEELHVA
jgi:hypothetical protein